MADTLIDLIQAVSSGGPQPAVPKPMDSNSTNPDNPGAPLKAEAYDPLYHVPNGDGTGESTWFPAIPDEVRGSFNNDMPARPGGATEVLSVRQVRGGTEGAPFGVVVRRYPVRGSVV